MHRWLIAVTPPITGKPSKEDWEIDITNADSVPSLAGVRDCFCEAQTGDLTMTDAFPDASPDDDEDNDYPSPPEVDDSDVGPDIEPGPEDQPATSNYPEAVDQPYAENAAAVGFTPSLNWDQGLAVPRARRELKGEHEVIKAALTVLKKRQVGESVELDHAAVVALICGKHDLQYPLADEPHITELRKRMGDLDIKRGIPLALDELEDVLATIEAALSALKAISLLGEPIPIEWSNLHPVLLARKLNVLGHTLLRGRIAGVSL